MSSINLQSQSAAYSPSQPSASGRLDVTWSGGVGTIDVGKITTKGGSYRHRRKHRHSRKCGHKKGRKHQKHQTRKAKRSKRD
jgi:hypothetical protein